MSSRDMRGVATDHIDQVRISTSSTWPVVGGATVTAAESGWCYRSKWPIPCHIATWPVALTWPVPPAGYGVKAHIPCHFPGSAAHGRGESPGNLGVAHPGYGAAQSPAAVGGATMASSAPVGSADAGARTAGRHCASQAFSAGVPAGFGP